MLLKVLNELMYPRDLSQNTYKNLQNYLFCKTGLEIESCGENFTNAKKYEEAERIFKEQITELFNGPLRVLIPQTVTEQNIMFDAMPIRRPPSKPIKKNSPFNGETIWSRWDTVSKEISNYLSPKFYDCCDKKGHSYTAPPSGKNLVDVLKETLVLYSENKTDKDQTINLTDEAEHEADAQNAVVKPIKFPLCWIAFIKFGPPAGKDADASLLPASKLKIEKNDSTAKQDSRKVLRNELQLKGGVSTPISDIKSPMSSLSSETKSVAASEMKRYNDAMEIKFNYSLMLKRAEKVEGDEGKRAISKLIETYENNVFKKHKTDHPEYFQDSIEDDPFLFN